MNRGKRGRESTPSAEPTPKEIAEAWYRNFVGPWRLLAAAYRELQKLKAQDGLEPPRPAHDGGAYSAGAAQMDGAASVAAEGTANPKAEGGRLQQAVRDVLLKLYPNGVPDAVSIETVRQQAIVELGRPVGWNTVNRALGRGK
jgi:hypothetical protein